MKEEVELKSGDIGIRLPRIFYFKFMQLELWNEYSSFSDMVRDSVRRTLEKKELDHDLKKMRESPSGIERD